MCDLPRTVVRILGVEHRLVDRRQHGLKWVFSMVCARNVGATATGKSRSDRSAGKLAEGKRCRRSKSYRVDGMSGLSSPVGQSVAYKRTTQRITTRQTYHIFHHL